MEFRSSKAIDERAYKVYRYINVSQIQILLTPNNRLDALSQRYANSDYISSYVVPKKEEDIIKHTTFLKMLEETKIDEIQKLEKEQQKLQKQIPFKVKYEENYLWQIYYDEYTNNYFMLVPTRR